jgi:putative ABC transport system permease protein
MILWKISLRNFFRNKRRNLFTVTVIVLGMMGLLLAGGFFNSLSRDLKMPYIYSEYGHLQVKKAGYDEKGFFSSLDSLIVEGDQLRDQIEALPSVFLALPQVRFQGILMKDSTSVAVVAEGIDISRFLKASDKFKEKEGWAFGRMVSGQPLDPEDPYGVAIGYGLMKSLAVKIGDQVDFLAVKPDGILEGIPLHIRTVFDIGDELAKNSFLVMNLRTAQEVLDIPNKVGSYQILLNDEAQTQQAKYQIEKIFQDKNIKVQLSTWQENLKLYWQSKGFLDRIFNWITIIIGVIFFISLAYTINVSILERVREYGTMMALGNDRSVIFYLILFEALIVGFTGLILGIFLGLLFGEILSSFHIQFPAPPPAPPGQNLLLRFVFSMFLIFQTMIFGVVASIGSVLIPAYRASRLSVIRALQHV